jgi:enoyl-CoA hydratase/carnithine racemase
MAEGARIERDGPVQILRFDRAEKKNAVTSAMYDALADALEAANGDAGIGVCIFLGAPGAFSAGNDIADFFRAASDGRGLGRPILRFLRALATCDRPLFAGVDGLAVGIGTTLLLHCDYVLATRRTVLRTPFTALGLVPEAASSLLAPRLLGHAVAFELLVMGRDMDGETACRCGIVNGIVVPEELEREVLAAARELAAKPREAVLASRRLLKGGPAEILARIDAEAEEFAERLVSAEAQDAFATFLNRR